MKRLLTVSFLIAFGSVGYADEKDTVLEEGVKFARTLWIEVLGRPELNYTKIAPEDLQKLYGTWRGARLGVCENPEMIFTLRKDGTWASKAAGPRMSDEEVAESEENGYWYSKDGMILLFRSEVTKGSEFDAEDFGSALIFEKGKLRLIDVLMPEGFIELAKEPSSEQDGAQQPAAASKPDAAE